MFSAPQRCLAAFRQEAGIPRTSRQLITGLTYRQTLIITTRFSGESLIPQMHVFGWWEDAGVPAENPCRQGDNMQTPQRKTPRESNQ